MRDRAKTVAIVSQINPLTARLGANEYLKSIAAMLTAQGYRVDLIVTDFHAPHEIRVPVGGYDDYAEPYRRVFLRRCVRIGGYIYSLDPQRWANRARRAIRAPDGVGQPWLPPLDPHAVRWVARRLRAIEPAIVAANYFNSAAAFAASPAKATRALITHDLIADRLASFDAAGVSPDFEPELAPRERAAFPAADVIIAIREQDRQTLSILAPGVPTVFVPMTVDTADVRARPSKAGEAPTVLFVGGGFRANLHGLRWFIARAWPHVRAARPDARLRVVGAVAHLLEARDRAPGVEPVGPVPTLDDEYAAADLAIAPLFVGSGMKIKIVEALGHGLPVVTTTCGSEGLEALPAGTIAVADDPQAFAGQIIAAVASDTPARRAERRAAVGTIFGRDAVGRRLAAALDEASQQATRR